MSGKIFISYRRDDSRYQARMIYEAFLRRMPRENVFMDIDTIPLGVNFVKVLEGWVEQCEVLLVLMGEDWANSTDPKTGKRRLDNPKDFVRVEVRGALTRDIPVVPVILDGAEIPDEAQLPDDIKGLLSRNAEFVEYRNFDADVQRLLKKLGVGGSAKAAAPATIAGTLRDQAIERSTRSSAEDFETQGDLAGKARERRTFSKEWAKHWLNPMVLVPVLLAAAVVGAVLFWSWSLEPISGRKADVAADSVERARQAAEVHAADAEKARQAAEAKAAEATAAVIKSEQARQAAEAQAADAEKARQVAAAKAADAEKARQAAETKAAEATAAAAKSAQARQATEAQAADAERARQAAAAKAADAEKARQAAETKAADAEKARQAAEAKAAEATDATTKSAQARQAAEAQAVEAEKARQAAEPKATGTVTSGLVSSSGQFSRRSNMLANGIVASPYQATVASTFDCEQNCARSNTCKVYSYDKITRSCFMYSAADLSSNATYDSGIRNDVSAAVTSSPFTPRRNMEAKGNTGPFASAFAASVDVCEQNCTRAATGCNVFTYNKKYRICYTYRDNADLVPNEDYDSGALATVTSGPASPNLQFSRRSNMEANGSADSPFTASAASVIDCEKSCAKSNTCAAYTFNKKSGSCFMYVRAEFLPNAIYDSGVREQAEARNAVSTKQLDDTQAKLKTAETSLSNPQGWLGVRIQQVTDDIADSLSIKPAKGALVTGVEDKGPAKPAGIEPGDVIVKFDGKDVKEMKDLPRIVADTPVGKDVEVVIIRKGQEAKKTVKLGRLVDSEKPAALPTKTDDKPEEKSVVQPEEKSVIQKILGLQLSNLTNTLRQSYKIRDQIKGVVITEVDANSAAAEKRLNPGDVIVEVAQEPIAAPADLQKRLDQLKKDGRKSALFLVSTADGVLRFVALGLQ